MKHCILNSFDIWNYYIVYFKCLNTIFPVEVFVLTCRKRYTLLASSPLLEAWLLVVVIMKVTLNYYSSG